MRRNERIDLNVIATNLEVGKRPQGGRLGFDGWAFDTASAALFSAFEFDLDIGDSGRQRIIRDALFGLNPTSTITGKVLASAVARQQEAYLKLPQRRYALLTSISVKFGKHLAAIRDGEVRIQFYRERPKRFDRKRFEKIHSWPKEPEVKDYAYVVVAVKARTTHEAFERALRELDYHRGMWNFALTRLTISQDLSSPQPLADVGLGKVHTIHESRGVAAGETFWYQPAFFEQRPIELRTDWARVRTESAVIRRNRRRSKYAETLKDVFVRYARALDGVDFDSTFLKLWSLLELLTGTTNARYDQTVNRALFVFEEQPLNRALLEHLRDHRNATVHDAASTDLVYDFNWQLKQFVDELIKFHIMWAGRFASWSEAAAFLDLPSDPAALIKRIARAKEALRYRGG